MTQATIVRTHYGEDRHPRSSWVVSPSDGALRVSDEDGQRVAEYPAGCWSSVRGGRAGDGGAHVPVEPLKVGDRVFSAHGKRARGAATIIHISGGKAWFSYGGESNGIANVETLTRAEI